jgi:hypothetical protein
MDIPIFESMRCVFVVSPKAATSRECDDWRAIRLRNHMFPNGDFILSPEAKLDAAMCQPAEVDIFPQSRQVDQPFRKS